jgi:tetratricopeptide (TPR) repeat protein
MRRLVSLLAVLALLSSNELVVADEAERLRTYREFRILFDAKRYQEALPVAQQLVTLTEGEFGVADAQLANPLSNLATTAYRLKDYTTAERHYLRGIEILENNTGATNKKILRLLHGLGATYLAQNQYENAIVPLKQAVDLSRNVLGLFNAEQLEFLQPLLSAYVATSQSTAASKEFEYRLRVVEFNRGKESTELLAPLAAYADWLERTDRYTSARALHSRALVIAEKSTATPLATVAPLRGIARTYRLEFLYGNTDNSNQIENLDINQRGLNLEPNSSSRLNPAGEKALLQALDVIRAQQNPDTALLGTTLLDLGDWYLSGNSTEKSMPVYRSAWLELAKTNITAAMEKPLLLAFRGSAAGKQRSRLDPAEAEERYVEISLNVTKEGRVSEATITGSDASQAVQKASQVATRKARYRPAFVAGVPAATDAVVLREIVLIKRPPPQ